MDVNRVRVCVVGDEFVAGVGDPKCLGWLGRVGARSNEDAGVELYPLAVPGESTAELADRWEGEVERRLSPEHECRLVVESGWADVLAGVSIPRSRLNLARILDSATRSHFAPLVIGPTPGPSELDGHISQLSEAFADVCGRRGFTYVDMFEPLVRHEQWISDLTTGDGLHPGQAGYGLMAWLVLHYGWESWVQPSTEQNR